VTGHPYTEFKAISKSSPILDRVWAFHVRDSTPPNLYPISKFFS